MVATIVNSSNVEHQGGRCETGTERSRWDCWAGKEVTGASGNLDEGLEVGEEEYKRCNGDE